MTDQNRPDEKPQFETDAVQANQAEQQGLGVGERELNAQREPGEKLDADELEDGAQLQKQRTDQDQTERQAPQA